VPKVPSKRRYLSPEEAGLLLAELHPDAPIPPSSPGRRTVAGGLLRQQREAAFDLCVGYLVTGCRLHELDSMVASQVDIPRRSVKVWGSKGSAARELPLVEFSGGTLVIDTFTRLVERAKLTKSRLLFPGKGGQARPGGSRALRRAMDSAGLNEPTLVRQFGRATTHSLRHTYASWLRQNGVKLDDLQPLLGHRDIKTTMIYAHIRGRDSMAAAVTAFDKVEINLEFIPPPTSAS